MPLSTTTPTSTRRHCVLGMAACALPVSLVFGGAALPVGSAVGMTVAIIPPSVQVLEADVVAIVTVLSAGEAAMQVKVAQSIKGPAISGQTVAIAMSKPAYFFDRARFLKSLIGKEVLVLASNGREGEGLRLLQYQFSVAPVGLPFSMLALSNAEDFGRYARQVLRLQALGSDLEALFRALADIQQDAEVYAAIDFFEHHLPPDLNEVERSAVRSLGLSLLVLDPARTGDDFVASRCVSLAPTLAQSLALPRLLVISRGNARARQEAAVALRAQLLPYRARPSTDAADIAATATELESLRAADVARYLPLLRATPPAMVAAAERLLGWILSATEAESSVGRAMKDGDARVAYWQRLLSSRMRK